MAEHVATTQQQYPWRAVARTALAVLIGIGVVVPAAVTVILAQFDIYLPAAAKAWLVGASAFTVALSGAVTKIIAIPAVDAWLARIGLSSAPVSPSIESVADEQAASNDRTGFPYA